MKHGTVRDLMHGFDGDKWTTGNPTTRRALIPAGQEQILEQQAGKQRWVGQMSNRLNFATRTSDFPRVFIELKYPKGSEHQASSLAPGRGEV